MIEFIKKLFDYITANSYDYFRIQQWDVVFTRSHKIKDKLETMFNDVDAVSFQLEDYRFTAEKNLVAWTYDGKLSLIVWELTLEETTWLQKCARI